MKTKLEFRQDLDDICHLPLATFTRDKEAIRKQLTPQEFEAVLVARRLMNDDF